MGKTAVFVTHDLHEAMKLGARIALMDKGRIVLLDTPANFQNSELPLVRKNILKRFLRLFTGFGAARADLEVFFC